MPSATSSEPERTATRYQRVAGPGVDMPVDDVMKNVARFNALEPDPNAFVDRSDPARRLAIRWPISPGHRAGPAGIATPHSFHMSFVESRAGNSPVVHAHAYREVFMPIEGIYRVYFNRECRDFVELGRFDTFSVPPLLWRRVEQQGSPGERGLLLVIYDNVEDPNAGIFVPQEVIDEDRARGADPYARGGS